MQEATTQASITTVDMALADGAVGEDLRESYSILLNWRPGQLLLINERYRLVRYLGRGGFGLVFAAYDEREQITVAVKFIHPCQTQSERQQRRIEREFDIAQKLQHPGLVRLLTLDRWQEIHFLVMELLDGPTLSQFIQEQGPLEWKRLEPLIHQLIDILAFVHQKNIVHRDIKPSNIIVVSDGVKLLDLGMTRELDDPFKTSSTGELVGSPHYLPPELIRGFPANQASDVYQLALVLYYAMTGRHPFEYEDTQTVTILGKQLSTPLKIPRQIHLPWRIRLILNHCLRKSPEMRPKSAQKLKNLQKLPLPLLHLRLVRTTRLRWKLLFLLGTSAAVWLLLWLLLPFSRMRSTLDGNLAGYNSLGMRIWQQDTPPQERPITVNHQTNSEGHPALRLLLGPKEERFTFRIDRIRPGDFPLRWLKLDTRGRITSETNLVHIDHMDYFDFFPMAMIESQDQIDWDDDGDDEVFLTIRQAESMFPCLHTVWDHGDNPVFTLYCPGAAGVKTLLDSLRLHEKDPGKDVCSIFLSNPFCHYYLWGWNIGELTVIPPVFDPQSMELIKSNDLVFLPQNSQLLHDHWHDEDWVEFISAHKQIRVRFERSGTMTVHLPTGEVRRFREPFEANAAAIATLNRVYFNQVQGEEKEAIRLLNGIDDSRLRNPYLLSLIEYHRAEASSRQGFFDQAFHHLDRALEHDPYNGDARNRRCELLLISKGPDEALESLNQQSSYYYQFWGLSYGQDLFRICCSLWAGRFSEANDLITRLVAVNTENANARSIPLNGMLNLFLREGNSIREAVNLFSQPQNTKSALFDVYEQQLILARLLTLDGQWQQAAEYLQPIYQKTTLFQPFAAVPLGWCDIESGRRAEGLDKIRSGFENIQKMALGQFWPRFWLFFDAYCYGRAMEKTGEAGEAARGYRICIEANPHTGLAVDAARRLKILK